MDTSKRVRLVMQQFSAAATAAANGVGDAAHSASALVSEKYDALKLTIELARLQDEQRKIFADVGRTMYLLRAGSYAASADTAEEEMQDTQKVVERLLFLADQRQQEIDVITARLAALNGSRVCSACGRVGDAASDFCSGCGTPLA